MDNFFTKFHQNLCCLLNGYNPCNPSELKLAKPNGVNELKPLDKEHYKAWRDRYVHDFWQDNAWANRELHCPIELFQMAHLKTLNN